MLSEEKTDELVKKISASKKYRPLYLKTIERAVLACASKYPEKQIEKQTRNLLHQIWGAYFPNRPNFEKLSEKLKKTLKIGGGRASAKLSSQRVKEAILPLLKLQSSVAERIPILEIFYQKIFAITGQPKTIIDWACGLNPLTWPWMDTAASPENCRYLGFDIDKEQNDFLNNIFKTVNLKQFEIKLGDILIDKSPQADVIFLLKLLPLLEHQQKGVSLEILKNLPANFLVVSFPTKTLGGKQRNMVDFYTKQFHDLIRNQPWQTEKILFPTELVFIIKK